MQTNTATEQVLSKMPVSGCTYEAFPIGHAETGQRLVVPKAIVQP